MLRAPSLERLVLNVDECQYEARAAYLVATGTSPFDVPHGAVFTSALFAAMKWLFGPHSMWQTRLLVWLIELSIVLAVYVMVFSQTNRIWAFLAALSYILVHPIFEGYSANREWFSVLPLVVAWSLYLFSSGRSGNRSLGLVYIAGVAAGISVWLKFQAVPLTLAIAAAIAIEAAIERAWRRPLAALLAYALGGLTACVLYLLPFTLHGTLDDHLHFVFHFKLEYAQVSPHRASPLPERLLTGLLLHTRLAGFLVVIYCAAAAALWAALVRIVGGQTGLPRPLTGRVALVNACALVTGLVAVQFGGRFFEHYFLYVLPQASVLMGLALASVFTLARSVVLWAAATLFAALLAVASMPFGLPIAAAPGAVEWLVQATIVAAASALLYFLFDKAMRRRQRAQHLPASAVPLWEVLPGPLIVTLLVLFLMFRAERLVSHTVHLQREVRGDARILDAEASRVPVLSTLLEPFAVPGARLFVWGWRPELYALTGMEPATRFVNCDYLVRNERYGNTEEPYGARQRELLMSELYDRVPMVICDARDNHPGTTRPDDYDLERFDTLRHFINERYRFLLRADDIDVYIAR